MKIDETLISYLEQLSYLKLTEEEKTQAKVDLSGIIGYMEKLNELDTNDCPALSHPFSAVNRFREDEVVESYKIEDILSNAPMKNKEYFIAPKTVE